MSVEVKVLGPLRVKAPGEATGEHRELLPALVAIAALEPAGVPRSAVDELLPASSQRDVLQALHGWLGANEAGIPRMVDQGGAWRLSAEVRVDWQVFRQLITAAQRDPSEAAGAGSADEEQRRLANALALIRGELFAGVPAPPAVQQLLRPHAEQIHGAVLHAVRRDVLLAQEADDSARADWAVRQGLTLLPQSEQLRRIYEELPAL